jgi:hypothetical protein
VQRRNNNFGNLLEEDMEDSDEARDSLEQCSFFYYHANPKGINKDCGEYLYFDSAYDIIKDL